MTNTYALTDYDVYDDEDNDDFLGKVLLARHLRKRMRKKRRRRKAKRKKMYRPIMGRPPIRKPRIVRGRPIKLRPIKVRNIPVKKRKPIPKTAHIKLAGQQVKKAKTPINHLIRTTASTVIKKPLSTPSKAEVKEITTAQLEASKKAMQSDAKSSKLIKTVAVVGLVSITGFGVYKFIKNKQSNNGHISTSK